MPPSVEALRAGELLRPSLERPESSRSEEHNFEPRPPRGAQGWELAGPAGHSPAPTLVTNRKPGPGPHFPAEPSASVRAGPARGWVGAFHSHLAEGESCTELAEKPLAQKCKDISKGEPTGPTRSHILAGSRPRGSPSFFRLALCYPLPVTPKASLTPGLPRAPCCTRRASAGLTLTLPLPAGRRALQPALDEPTFPGSVRGGWSPAMTGTSCTSTPPSTPRRRSSWPCKRPCPTRSAPSSWCPTRWPRRTPEAPSTRAVSTGSGGHSVPKARADCAGQGGPPGGGSGFWTGRGLQEGRGASPQLALSSSRSLGLSSPPQNVPQIDISYRRCI